MLERGMVQQGAGDALNDPGAEPQGRETGGFAVHEREGAESDRYSSSGANTAEDARKSSANDESAGSKEGRRVRDVGAGKIDIPSVQAMKKTYFNSQIGGRGKTRQNETSCGILTCDEDL